MKKFLLFIFLTTFVSFGSLKLKAEPKLISESFEVSELNNEVSGHYLDHITPLFNALKASWKVTNISSNTVIFNVTLENISMGDSHLLEYCIGEACSFLYSTSLVWHSSNTMELAPGAATKPILDSYLAMYSGNDSSDAIAMVDTFRVTYKNVNNNEDYVSFFCIWDFKESSIKAIEDISNKIFPNPTSEQLNLILGEFNINEIELFDINGNKLLSQNVTNLSEVNIDIASLTTGVYVGYFVKSGKRIKVFRFVKD